MSSDEELPFLDQAALPMTLDDQVMNGHGIMTPGQHVADEAGQSRAAELYTDEAGQSRAAELYTDEAGQQRAAEQADPEQADPEQADPEQADRGKNRLLYVCKRGCVLLDCLQTDKGIVLHHPGHRLSTALAGRTTELGREYNTTDGPRHWKPRDSFATDAENQLGAWPAVGVQLVCKHLVDIVLTDAQFIADWQSDRGTVVVGPRWLTLGQALAARAASTSADAHTTDTTELHPVLRAR